MSFKLYLLTSPDGLHYVGVTGNMQRRRAAHRRRLGDVVIRVLVIGRKDYIYNLEREAIRVFVTRHPKGLNLADGGYGSRDFLPIMRAKLAKSLQGNKNGRGNRGRARPDIAERNHTRPVSAETRQRQSLAKQKNPVRFWAGKKRPACTKDRISVSLKGRPWSGARRLAYEASHV